MASRDPDSLILTVDVGTSSLKTVLYNRAGQVIATASRPYSFLIPQSGWAEADPADWWTAFEKAVAELQSTGASLEQVRAIGLTGQMHSAVLLDGSGQPLSPTILWLDRRAGAELAELQERLNLPASRLNSTFTLPRLLWLARNQPDVLAETKMILWPKDYIRYRLTGRYYTDVTEAGGAALVDEERQDWAPDRLALTGLLPSVLPPIRPATDDAGPLRADVAERLGLPVAAKVIVGAGDVIALLGGAPPRANRLCCSLGSSGMISVPLSPQQPVNDPAQRLYVYPFLPYRLLNGVLSTSGAALTWAWQALYDKQTSFEMMVEKAIETSPGNDGLLFLPYLAGERSPYWNDDLRGGFYGLTLNHNRHHMTRAVLEGVAFSLRHLIEVATELGVTVNEVALAGGGASTPGWAQIIADVCQRPVFVFTTQDTVTRPLYAYCTAALYPDITFDAALQHTFSSPVHYQPNQRLATVYDENYRLYRQLVDFVAQLKKHKGGQQWLAKPED
jgi:xylulokinase